jgi:hypothetical protein
MSGPDLEAVAREIRRNYDRCTQAIVNKDPDGFAAAFGPAARGETAEGIAATMRSCLLPHPGPDRRRHA